MEIYKDEKHISIHHTKGSHFLIQKWRNMAISVERMKKLQETQLPYVEKNGITAIILDTKEAKSVTLPDSVSYYITIVEPKLAKLGVKRIVTISSEKLLTNLTNKKWQDASKGMDLYQVSSMSEAERIVRELSPH